MPRRPPAFPVLKLGDEGVVDCCGDGSVLKLTKKAARARHVKSPVDGDECTTHKRGWLAENPCKEGEFEDSKEGGEPYQFLVGGGGAVKGLSDAVRHMRRGEVAYVWMAGRKGLGEEGNPPKIPKHAALCFELELLKFTDGKDVSPEMDGSVLTRRVKKGASRPRGFLSPHDKSTITFDFELWVSGTSDEPLDRPLANVGAVWYAHERERKPGYPKGLRVLLENVFQNDVVHAVMSKQAVEHYEGVDAIPEGGALECLVKLRSWHEFIDCHERDPGMIRKEINKFAGASKWQIPAHADVVVVRGQVMVAGKSFSASSTRSTAADRSADDAFASCTCFGAGAPRCFSTTAPKSDAGERFWSSQRTFRSAARRSKAPSQPARMAARRWCSGMVTLAAASSSPPASRTVGRNRTATVMRKTRRAGPPPASQQ